MNIAQTLKTIVHYGDSYLFEALKKKQDQSRNQAILGLMVI